MHERLAGGAVLLGALDFGFLTLAGPRIERALQLGDAYPWLFSAGSFAFAAALPVAGALVERHGARRVLRAGAVVWALGVGSLAIAPSFAVALAARVVAGVGGAALLPSAWTVLGELDGAARRRGFAASGGAIAAGFSLGIALGGPVAGVVGWRAACVIVALLAVILAMVPSGPPPLRRTSAPAGTVWLVGVAASLALAAGAREWSPFVALAGLVGALLAASRLRRADWLPTRWSGLQFCVLSWATTASGVGATALLGQALVRRAGGDAVVLVAFAVAVPLVLPAAAGLIRRSGAAACAITGLAVQGAALATLAATHTSASAIVPSLAIAGAGHVLANAGTAQLAMDGGGRPGPVAALLGMAQYVGGAVGALLIFGAAGEGADYALGLRVAAALAFTGAVLGAITGRRATASAFARTTPPS